MKRDYWNKEKYERTILTALFRDYKYSFSGLQKTINCNSGVLRKYLDALIAEGLVSEEVDELQWKRFDLEKMAGKAKNWKTRKNADNRPKIIDLTEKGREECIRHNVIAVQQSIENLGVFTSILLSDPTSVDEYFKTKNDKNLKETVGKAQSKPGTFSKAFDEYLVRDHKVWTPLLYSMFKLHVLLVRLRASNADCSKFATIIEGDKTMPLTIPLRLLEGIPFEELAVLGAGPEDQKIKWKVEEESR